MLTYEQIKELIQLVTENRLAGVEVETSGFRLKVHGVGVPSTAPSPALAPSASGPSALATPSPAAPVADSAPAVPPPTPSAGLHVVTSPIVGTFYSAPSPEADAFVRPGDRVRKGQVLCIIEAMKLMNEIECDVDGTLAEAHPKNGQPVEYGEPLFSVRPD